MCQTMQSSVNNKIGSGNDNKKEEKNGDNINYTSQKETEKFHR